MVCPVVYTVLEDLREPVPRGHPLHVHVAQLSREQRGRDPLKEMLLVRFDLVPFRLEVAPRPARGIVREYLGRPDVPSLVPEPFDADDVAQQSAAGPKAAAPLFVEL